jgi:quercetin dioxygenase-like cupin family protein
MLASAATGATQLCVFEQLSEPGTGAPGHVHPGVEELLAVLSGEAEIWIGSERLAVEAGGSVVVPPGARHGFANAGSGVLHTMAVFPVPSPPVRYDEEPETLYEVGAVRAEMRDAHRAVSETSEP